MRVERVRKILRSLVIIVAIYPIVMIGVWGLVMIGVLATDLHMPTDSMPLVYGLVFATLTFALIDILGIASVVIALISCANLIEYAQLVVPGRSASVVDFIAGMSGVIVAALLVWAARTLLQRAHDDEIIHPEDAVEAAEAAKPKPVTAT